MLVTYQLRLYQELLIQEVFSHWNAAKRRVMLQLPTGGGKTVLFAAITREFISKGESVLVLAHREELIVQAKEKIEQITQAPVGIIKAGHKPNPLFPIQVASVQTLTRRENFPPAALVICDEAHHSCSQSYKRIFEAYPEAYILGVTATPARIDGQGFKFLYDALALGPSVAELMEQGHLSSFKLFIATKLVKTKGVRKTGGDFNQRELKKAVNTSLAMGDLIDTWLKFADQKKTVVFAVDVDHSKAIATAYKEAGIPAEHLDGETPDLERQAILERFRTGQTLVLSNCGIISEGFDVPSIEAIQCVRPTQSLPLWLQMVGRSLRPHPGKNHAIIIDHTENCISHGLPNEERDWSLEPKSLDTKEKWTYICSECQHVFKPLPHEQKPFRHEWNPKHEELIPIIRCSCPDCATVLEFKIGINAEPPPPRKVDIEQASIEEVNVEANPLIIELINLLFNIQKRGKYKKGWFHEQLAEVHPQVSLGELNECAKLLGIKRSWRWAWDKWQEVQTDKTTSQPYPAFSIASLLKQCANWDEVMVVVKAFENYKVEAWGILPDTEKTRLKELKKQATTLIDASPKLAVGLRVRVNLPGYKPHRKEGLIKDIFVHDDGEPRYIVGLEVDDELAWLREYHAKAEWLKIVAW